MSIRRLHRLRLRAPPQRPQVSRGAPANPQGSQDNGGRRSVTAVRLAEGESIALDGRLDEPSWSKAIPAGDFMQIDPTNGDPGLRAHRGPRRLSTANGSISGSRASTPNPDAWIGWQLRRDERLNSDDGFMWTIDTFLDGRTGYFFEMNPSGLMADALMGPNGRQSRVGTASGMRACCAAKSGGRSRSRYPSAP